MSTLTLPSTDRVVVDDATRREFLAVITAAGLLTACDTTDDESPDAGGPSGGVRVYTDATGAEVEIPVRPQRIAAVHANQTGQPLVSLGAPVIASTVMDLGFLDDYDTSGITDVSTAEYAVNVEALAALDPDVIVSFTEDGEPVADGSDYEALRSIAPLVFVDTSASLDEVMAAFGDIAGLADEAEQQRLAWEDTADRLRDSAPAGLSAAYVSNYGDGGLLAETSGFTAVAVPQVMDLMGLIAPPVMADAAAAGESRIEISGERLADISADLLLWSPAASDPAELALWDTLPAVRAGQVAPLPAGNTSYDAYQRVAAALEAIVADADPTVVDESTWS
jgi:iron complex transport system substrate-binding protein